MKWTLHALTKKGVENDFPKAVEDIADSIPKDELFNSSRQLHSANTREERATLYKDSADTYEENIKEEDLQTTVILFYRRINDRHRPVTKKHATCCN